MALPPPPQVQSVQWCDLPTECIQEALRGLPLLDVGLAAAACHGNAIAAATLGTEAAVFALRRQHILEVWSRRHALLVHVEQRERSRTLRGLPSFDDKHIWISDECEMDDILQWRDPLPPRRYLQFPQSYFQAGEGWHCYAFDHQFEKFVGHHEAAAEQASAAFTRLALALEPREHVRYLSLKAALKPAHICLIRRMDKFQKCWHLYGGCEANDLSRTDVVPVWRGSEFDIIDRYDDDRVCRDEEYEYDEELSREQDEFDAVVREATAWVKGSLEELRAENQARRLLRA